jgi:sphinganine C4-monooxygenase
MPSFYLTSSVDTDGLISSTVSKPFYYIDRPRWHPQVSDKGLAILAPLVTYWVVFLLYRFFLLLHFPRRRVPKRQPVRLVLEIQIVQTLFGLVWLTRFGEGERSRDIAAEMRAVGKVFTAILSCLIGNTNARAFLNRNGEDLVQFAYWWAIPVAKQFLASSVPSFSFLDLQLFSSL